MESSDGLIKAIDAGDSSLAKKILAGGADPNSVDSEGKSALQLAAQNGLLQIVKLLISRGADVNSTDAAGETPFISAAANGQTDVMEYLLSLGKQSSTGAKKKFSCLSCRSGSTVDEAATQPTVNAAATTGAGETAAQVAARNGHPEVAEWLQKHGVQVDQDALSAAADAAGGFLKTVSTGYQEASSHKEEIEQLIAAVKEKDAAKVAALVAQGVDTTALEERKDELKQAAEESGNDELLALIGRVIEHAKSEDAEQE